MGEGSGVQGGEGACDRTLCSASEADRWKAAVVNSLRFLNGDVQHRRRSRLGFSSNYLIMFLSDAIRIIGVQVAQMCLFGAPVEQTYAAKVRRRQAAFVHEVGMTDAPQRVGDVKEDDAISFSWASIEVAAV